MRKHSLILAMVLAALLAAVLPRELSAQSAIFQENFDSITSGIPSGWDNQDGSTTSDTYRWKSFATGHAGRCVRFDSYTNSDENTNMLKTPTLDLTNGAILSFWYKNPTGGDFSVYVSTDNGVTYPNLVASGLVNASTWTYVELSITAAAQGSSTAKVVFKGTSNYGNGDAYIYLDDVTLMPPPACAAPKNIVATTLRSDSVALGWSFDVDGSVPGRYYMTVTTDAGVSAFADSIPAGQSYGIGGLVPNTTYHVQIKGDCNASYDGYSSVSTFTFTTPCLAGTVPYYEDFASSTLPACTFSKNAALNSTVRQGTTGYALALNPTVAEEAYIVFPELTVASDSVEVEFYLKAQSVSGYKPKYMVGLVTDLADIATSFEPLRLDSLITTAWQLVRFNTRQTQYGSQPTARVCLFLQSGMATTCYLDNVDIHHIPSCVRPEDLAVTDYTATTVSLGYTSTNATNIQAMIISGTDTAYQSVTGNPCTVTGLMPNTGYDIRLRGDCGGGDYSAWTRTSVTVQTSCNVADSAYFDEDFETIIQVTGAPECWSQGWITKPSGNTLARPFIQTNVYHSASRAMALAKQASGSVAYLSSQAIPVATAGAYDVSIWVRRDNATNYAGENIAVWVNTVPNSTVGGTLLGTISRDYHSAPAEQADGWYRYLYPINATGNLYVVLVGTSLNGAQLVFDDVAVIDHVTCTRVLNITDNGLGGTDGRDWSAGWTPTSGESAWEVTATVNGVTTVTTETTPAYALTGLQLNTAYSVSLSIRALCAPGDTSEASIFSTTFRTPCGVERAVACDAEDATFPPACWTVGASTGANPTRSTYEKHNGAASIEFEDKQSANSSWIVSPVIDFGTDSTVYTIDFWFYRSDYSSTKTLEGVQVYVGPSDDYANDTQIFFVPREMSAAPAVTTEGFYNYYVNVPDSIRGLNHVIFRYYNEWGDGSFIDDIVIGPAASCRAQTVTVSNVTNNSAVVNVDSTGISQQVAYGPQGTAVAGCTLIDTVGAGNQITLTGLVANTAYTVYARRVCAVGDTSAWSGGVIFTTACDPVALPIVADGEDPTFPPVCWQVSSTGNYLPERNSTSSYIRTGNYSIKFPDQQRGNHAILTTPVIAFNADSNYIISLSAYRVSASSYPNEGLCVYISDDANDTTGATLVQYVHRHYGYDPVETAAGYYDYRWKVTGISGNKYVLFYYVNEYGLSMYVDDISIVSSNECLAISARDSDPTQSSVVITAVDETDNWQIAYGTSSTPADMTIVTVTDTTAYTITGLTAQTTYNYYVRAICGAGDTSAWSNIMGTFATTRELLQLPFYCGFENQAQIDQWEITNSNTTNTLAVGTAANAVYSGTSALYVQNAGAYGYSMTTTTNARAYALLHFEPRVYQMEFQWRCTGGESSYDYGRVLLIPAGVDPASVTSYGDVPAGAIEFGQSLKEDGTTYADHRLNLTPGDSRGWNIISEPVDMTACAGNYYLLVFWHNDSSGGKADPFAVDNFNIYELTCPNPAVQITGLTSTGVTLNYSSADAVGYEVIVDDEAISPDAINDTVDYIYRGIDTVGHATVDSLTPNTMYYYTIRTICQNGDTAAWKAPGSFTTFCAAVPLPYSETFEAETSVNCWSAFTGQTAPARNTQYHFQGTASMKIYEAQAISPEFIVDSLNHYMVTGYAYSTAATQLGVGLITDPSDLSTYETFGNCNINEANTWTEFNVMFTDLDDPDFADYRAARNIVLTAPTGTTIYVDNVRVMEIPECPKPTDPVISNVTAATVDISFTDNASATAWVVQVNGSERVVTTNPATVTGLNAHTTYDINVAAICASGDTSDYTYFGRTTTACDTMTMPYAESFESMPTTYAQNACELICWDQINAAPSGDPQYYGYAGYTTDGTKSLKLTGAATGLYLIMPALRGLTACTMTFSTRFESSSSSGDLGVGYITDIADASTFVELQVISKSNGTTIVEHELDLGGIPAGARLAFHYYNGSNAWYVWIDNVRVEAVGTCAATSRPETGLVTATSAEISFTDTCTAHTAWEYVLVPQGADLNDSTVVHVALDSVGTFTITGLAEHTAYTVAVRALCGGGDMSPWRSVDFTTACNPFVVTLATPFHDSFEDQTEDAMVGGCYSVLGASGTYFPEAYPNSSSYIYSHTGNIGVYNYYYNMPDGMAITHDFYLEAGHNYEASVWAMARTYEGNVDILIAPQGNLAGVSTVAAATLSPAISTTVGGVYTYAPAYRELYGSFTVPTTGVYTIGIHAYRQSGPTGYAYLYYDDFSVVEYSCPTLRAVPAASRPTATTAVVTADLLGNASAEIGWATNAANVTSADIEGTQVTNTESTTVSGLTPGTTYVFYYRVICAAGDTSNWSPVSNAITTFANDCFDLQDVAVRSVTDSSATFGWRLAPLTVNVEYELRHDSTLVASGSTTADSIRFDGLSSATIYTLSVRGLCTGDTTAWVSVSALTAAGLVPAPFVCDFEDVDFNRQWRSYRFEGTNSFVVGGNAASGRNGGTRGLYVSSNGSSHQYAHGESRTLAFMRVSFAPGDWMIQYDWKSAGETGYDGGHFFLLPDTATNVGFNYTTLPAGAISLETNGVMVDNNNWITARATFSNTGTEPVNYRLCAAWINDVSDGAQPPLAIDNVTIASLTCAYPTNVKFINHTDSSVTAIVTRADAEVALQYAVSASRTSDSTTVWTTISRETDRDTILLTGLSAGTTYYLLTRHACDATNLSPEIASVFFTLSQGMVTLPYVCSFEGSEDLSGWNTASNAHCYFVIGGQDMSDGSQSMYITDDGTSYNYSSSTALSFAEIPVGLTETGIVNYSYDWKCNGERNFDYGRVLLAPSDMVFVSGSSLQSGLSYSVVPDGCIALGTSTYNGTTNYQLNKGGTDWNTITGSFNVSTPGAYKLVVCWYNDGSGDYQPPFAIDNIQMSYLSCPKLTIGNRTFTWTSDTSCVIKVYGNNEGASLRYHVATSTAFTDTVAYGTSPANADTCFINLTGLPLSTAFYVQLISECGQGNESEPYMFTFRTRCEVYSTYPWREGFETMTPVQTANVLENNCWYTWNSTGAGWAATWSTVDGSGPIAGISHDGTAAILANTGTDNYGVQVVGLPTFVSLEGKWFSFWYRAIGGNYYAADATAYYGYLTNPQDGSTFVSLGTITLGEEWAQHSMQLTGLPDTARLAVKITGQGYALFDDFEIHEVVNGPVYNEVICNEGSYIGHGFNVSAADLAVGANTVTRYEHGAADTLITLNIVRLAPIEAHVNDTICGGQPYTNGQFSIAVPETKMYRYIYTGGSHDGCDSTVFLHLVVLPSSHVIYDTICGGATYQFGDQQINSAGLYTRTYTSAQGCSITDSLYLTRVVDTIPSSITICESELPYQWGDQSLTSAGVYTRQAQGQHGCPQTFVLTLDVITEDSVVNLTFCRGGQAQVADTIITTAGSYTLHRYNIQGCDIVYRITATVTDPQPEVISDVACEGKLYNGYGITGLTVTADTVVVINTLTADALCDSIAEIHITYHPTVTSEFTVRINEGETYEWNDNTYSVAGDYPGTFQDQYGCDSVVTLHLEVGNGVDDVTDNGRIRVVPNPAGAGQAALVFVSGTGEIARVEIINSYGAVINTWEPRSTPIDLTAPQTAGVYHVRVVTTDGRVYVEKLIVR